jgi:hypothetical protein
MGMRFSGYKSWETGLKVASAVNYELAYVRQLDIAERISQRAKQKVHKVDGTMEEAIGVREEQARSTTGEFGTGHVVVVGVVEDLERLGGKRDEETTFKYAVPLEFGHEMGGIAGGGWVQGRPFLRPAIEEVLAEEEAI